MPSQWGRLVGAWRPFRGTGGLSSRCVEERVPETQRLTGWVPGDYRAGQRLYRICRGADVLSGCNVPLWASDAPHRDPKDYQFAFVPAAVPPVAYPRCPK